MHRVFRGRRWGLAVGLSMALAGLAVGPAAGADALTAVQVLREGGCGGIVPAAEPLRHSALLDVTAERWAAGRSLLAATKSSGYRAKSTTGWHVTGPDSSLLQLLRRSDCRKIANRSLSDIGVYRRGEDTWLVLASTYAARTDAAPTDIAPTNAPPIDAAPAAPMHASPALAMLALREVNEVRARGTRCGTRYFGAAAPLSLSQTLGDVALGHAHDMAEHHYFEHVDLAGQSPADRVRAVGYRDKLVGENIAYGPQTVDEVMKGWLGSPGHCENIMDPRFVEMGLGYSPGSPESSDRPGPYWVQVFATPRD